MCLQPLPGDVIASERIHSALNRAQLTNQGFSKMLSISRIVFTARGRNVLTACRQSAAPSKRRLECTKPWRTKLQTGWMLLRLSFSPTLLLRAHAANFIPSCRTYLVFYGIIKLRKCCRSSLTRLYPCKELLAAFVDKYLHTEPKLHTLHADGSE